MSTFSSDHARVSGDEDLYGWSTAFVPMLAKVTRKWPPRDGLTFGVYGPWGSGKSTVLNMLESQLDNDEKTYPNTYLVRFNPWFYDSSQTLVTSFFASLGATLKADSEKPWAAAGDLLKKMGKFLAVASKGLTLFGVSYDIDKAVDSAGGFLNEAGESLADGGEKPLRDIRDKLVKHLNDLGQAGGRVMVLIDDVDRLDEAELFTLLRLLRTVADLPSITLLVSMDEHRIFQVLNGAAGRGYGRAYLEKIVQAHVHVPMPPEDTLRQQLKDGIREILKAARAEIPTFLNESGDDTGTRVLNRIVKTPRDLGRYLNGLRILTLARDEWDLNATDAIHLAALHVFYPEVYERVRRSRAYLANGHGGAQEFGRPPRSLRWFLTGTDNDTEGDADADEAASLIRAMFGDYEKPTAAVSTGTLVAERRIASAEVFYAYFAFDPEPQWVPRAHLRDCFDGMVKAVRSGDKNAFLSLLRGVVTDRRISAELTRSDLIAAICALEIDAAVSFAESLLDVMPQMDEWKWFTFWNAYMASTHQLIKKHEDFEVMRRLTIPVKRWIESGPDAGAKATRNWLYNASERYQ